MVSIIVPIYNMEAYLQQCLDSLYAQVDDTMEVILVNDGSTDFSPQIAKEYLSRYPATIYINKVNGGLADARNAGVEKATGKYVYFIDSDDWLAPDAIRTLYDFAEKNDCEVVQGGFYYAFADHLEYDDRWIKPDSEPFVLNRMEAMTELVKQQYVKNFAWGKLLLTDLARQLSFKVGVNLEDAFWKHLVIDRTERYGVVPRPLYYYRQRSDSISASLSFGHLNLMQGHEERLLFLQKHYPELVLPMAASFWRQALQFHEMALHTPNIDVREAFEAFWQHINLDYRHLYDQTLRHNITYQLVKHIPSSAHLCLFIRRVYDHFFARRLMTIPVNSINMT